jgi:cell wall-associated NlpC family hydrolase
VVVPDADGPVLDPLRLQVIFSAIQQVGVPYAWGGSSPSGFDCSGLVQYVFGNAGFPLPRTAAEQLGAAAALPLSEAAPGDLLFFRDRGTTSHVAIYLGDGRFVHAPRTGRHVSLDTFDGNAYWRSRFAGAGRVIPRL